ncbi:MAG: putative sugar nucleotidyl transferase, partial [Phycisphaerae bacterium]
MQVVVFEDAGYRNLLPLTYTRAACELRVGVDTLFDKIRAASASPPRLLVREALSEVVAERRADAVVIPGAERIYSESLWINGRLLLQSSIDFPGPTACWADETLVAARLPADTAAKLSADVMMDPARTRAALAGVPQAPFSETWGRLIRYPWDLIAANRNELVRQITAMPSRRDGRVDAGATLLKPDAVRIGPGSRIMPAAVLDAESGPIHIGRDVTISPGAVIRGPCSIGDGCLIHPGASIREGTTIGPVCKVGGEIEGTIFQGYANKQ